MGDYFQRPPVEVIDAFKGGAGQWFIVLWQYLQNLQTALEATFGKWATGSVQTTDATATTICTFTTETGKVYLLIGRASCSRETWVTGEAYGSRMIMATAKNDAGTVSLADQATVFDGFVTFSTLDLDFSVTGSSAVVSLKVTGRLAENINWQGSILALDSV